MQDVYHPTGRSKGEWAENVRVMMMMMMMISTKSYSGRRGSMVGSQLFGF